MDGGGGGGGGGGGFHGYRRLSQTNSGGMKPTDMNMRLPLEMNNHTLNHDNNTINNQHLMMNSTITNAIVDVDHNECTVREQDRFMPIANVIRIMRKILPPHAKISDDAKETIQECVSEYISFVTSEANERCQKEQRKTITAEDVLWAMSKLGFDDYIEPLTLYLHRYREMEGDRGAIRGDNPLMMRRPALSSSSSSLADQYGISMGVGGVAGFAPPAFHMHPAAAAYFGSSSAAAMTGGGSVGYVKDAACSSSNNNNNNNAGGVAGGSSQAALDGGTIEPQAQFK